MCPGVKRSAWVAVTAMARARLLADKVLVGDVMALRDAAFDLVRNRLGHHCDAVDDWTDRQAQRAA